MLIAWRFVDSVNITSESPMSSVIRTLREHLHFLIIVPLLIIATTWPLAQNILDVHSLHRPPGDADVLIEFWDAWYGELLLGGRANYFYTELLFYPDGLSLAFHHIGLPHILIFRGLQAVLPTVNAFFLTYMITVFSNALASYIFLRQLFPGKWIALVGAVIFSFSPYFLTHAHHLDQITIWTIPLTLYAFHRGIVEGRWKWLFAAGFFAGLTAFIIMYNLVCLFVAMALYTLYLASTRWRQHRFWFGVALTVLVAASIGIIRITPMIVDQNFLGEALDKGANAPNSTDLLVFLVNPRHPFTPTVFDSLFHRAPPKVPPNGYLGFLPLLLIVVGLFRSANRRLMAPWLIMLVFFVVLRLGHVLQIDGQVFSNLLLPKHYLDLLVPWLTKAFWDTSFFQIGILLPLAVLTCYGLQAILVAFPRKLRPFAVLACIALLAFEYYQPPTAGYHRHQPRYQWIDWLAAEPEQDAIRLINLPMGRNRSKRYLYHQTLHGYPQVEGLAGRTPESAYDYIDGNLLLKTWRADESITCSPGNRDDFAAAQAQLVSDGFTHIILHRGRVADEDLAHSFVDVPAAYADELVQIFRLGDLGETCDASAALSETVARFEGVIDRSGVIIPQSESAILAIYPLAAASAIPGGGHLTVLKTDGDLLRFEIEAGDEVSRSAAGLSAQHADVHLSAKSLVLFAYDPSAAAPDAAEAYRVWLFRHFRDCGRVADGESAVIEIFLRAEFACELVLSDAPLAVNYDDKALLGNAQAASKGDTLQLAVLWKRLPVERHAVSIQFFDESENKAYGQDFVVRDALSQYEIDLSSLAPGTYAVKLIVYNYATGLSLPGTDVSSQTRFERELEFMTLTTE